jgi:hypothetical protein
VRVEGPVNTSADEAHPSFSPDGLWFLFASDRDSPGSYSVFYLETTALLAAAPRPEPLAEVGTRDE